MIHHIGDLHTAPDRIAEIDEILKAAIDFEDYTDTDVCLHGDNFTSSRNDWLSAIFFSKWLMKFLDATAGNIYVLQGNHDPKGDNNVYGLIETLINSDRLFIVKKGEPIVRNGCLFIPYTLGLNELMTDIPDGVHTVCGHFSTPELLPNDPGNINPVLISDNPGVLFITGHYHKPSSFGNLVNVGSALRWRFDEADQVKQVLVSDHGEIVDGFNLPAWPMKEVEINDINDLVNLNSLTGFDPDTVKTGRYNLKLRLKARIDSMTVAQFVRDAGLTAGRIETDIDFSGISDDVVETAVSIGGMTIDDGIEKHLQDGNVPDYIDRSALRDTIMKFYVAPVK